MDKKICQGFLRAEKGLLRADFRKRERMPARMSARATALVLVTVLVLALLCGCAEVKITHPLGKQIMLEIDDAQCTLGTAALRLMEAKEEYQNSEDHVLWIRNIGDITLAEYVKDTVKDEIFRYTAAQVMARDLTVFITDEERSQAEQDARNLLNELEIRYNLSKYNISTKDAVDLFLKRIYYNKVFEKLSENILMEISEADIKVIEIDYVFIPAEDGIEVAERMRNELRGGAEFAAVCADYGYEAVLNQTMKKGTMPAAFETKAYALRDNEISEIVETRDGYYIIYCLEDYKVAESLANKNMMISDGKRTRFQQAYETFAATAKMRFNDAEWDKLDIISME